MARLKNTRRGIGLGLMVAVLLVGALGVASAGLKVPTLVAPINGATGVVPPVVLQWTAVDKATEYVVHVSTDATFTTLVVAKPVTGTQMTLPWQPAGTQLWWEVAAQEGTVRSAFSPNQTFTLREPAFIAPVLVKPANAATAVVTSPTLQWYGVSGSPNGYSLEVSLDSTFTTDVFSGDVSGTSKPLTGLLASTEYYWRVRAHGGGFSGIWSNVWSFITVAAPPAAPTLVAPISGAIGIVPPVLLKWTAITGALGYVVHVSTDSTFTTLVVAKEVAQTYMALPWQPEGTQLWWEVLAQVGTTRGTFSSVGTFTLREPAFIAPVLIAPANAATEVVFSPTLQWYPVSGSPYGYSLEVSLDSTFATDIFHGDVSGTSKQLDLSAATQYYWRVRAHGAGHSGIWSNVWSFTTAPPAAFAAPQLVSPTDGATGVSTSPTLEWDAVTGAAGYWVEVAYADNFAAGTILISGPTANLTKKLSGLPTASDGVMLYWRVQATGGGKQGAWSDTWSFTTTH